jgi:hypothetical protein
VLKRLRKSALKTLYSNIDSSDDESFDQEYSRWSEYARTRAKSKSPQPPKMPLFSGSGKLTFEAFMEEKILDSLYLTIGNSDSLRLGYWLESGHLTDPGQIAEY